MNSRQLGAMFHRNIRYFERIVARAEADNCTTLPTWQGCLRAAQKRLERHLAETQDSE